LPSRLIDLHEIAPHLVRVHEHDDLTPPHLTVAEAPSATISTFQLERENFACWSQVLYGSGRVRDPSAASTLVHNEILPSMPSSPGAAHRKTVNLQRNQATNSELAASYQVGQIEPSDRCAATDTPLPCT
jgi:hypothetical protein